MYQNSMNMCFMWLLSTENRRIFDKDEGQIKGKSER